MPDQLSKNKAIATNATHPFMHTAWATILAVILLSGAVSWAQINTEALRREDRGPGWYASAAADLGYLAGNANLLKLKSTLRLDYVTPTNHLFAVGQYQQGRKDGQLFIHQGFAHFRWVRSLSRRLFLEGFLQREFNPFIRLRDRQLAGGGMRVRWHKTAQPGSAAQPLQLHTGIGLMFEREVINPPATSFCPCPTTVDLVRSTNYLALRWQTTPRLALNTTAYYQVHIRRISDFRVYCEGNLQVKLTKRLAVNIKVNLRYDHEPPDGVQPYDLDLTNGLSYSL